MAMYVLFSAAGSPGVTTSVLGLALGWHRPVVLVEADPTGGSAIAAGYLKGSIVPLEAMIELALAHQEGQPLLEVLPAVSVDLPGSRVSWVPGTRSHEQARTLLGLWEPLTSVLRSLDQTGQDVLVDAGRLGLYGSPEPLIEAADLALLLTRTDLVSLAAARSWAESLRERFTRAGAAPNLGVLLVGEGEPFTAREVCRVLGLPVLGTIVSDSTAAAVLSAGQAPPRAGLGHRLAGRSDWQDSPLLRSYRATRSAITARVRAHLDELEASSRSGS
ncbi:MAG: hypothetical protein GX643_06580 [Acidimicrobiales bacterium]|nr:hypothetical protein [Acidimicrobiales bacterium]